MSRPDKYDGGSKLVAFRLPLKHLEEAKKGIRLFLERFMTKPGLDNKIGWPVTPKEAIAVPERLDELGKKEKIDPKSRKNRLSPELIEILQKADPKIIIPGETESAGFGVTEPKEKLIVYTNSKNPREFENVPEDHVSVVVKQGENGFFEWSCGCIADNNLFRRSDNCKLPILKHLK